MHILYLADIRFPLERANGIQSMETCHALATRGHQVRLTVRADTAHPARDPFAFYDLSPLETLSVDRLRMLGPQNVRRATYVTCAITRATIAPPDVVFTRDLGVAMCAVRSWRWRVGGRVRDRRGVSENGRSVT